MVGGNSGFRMDKVASQSSSVIDSASSLLIRIKLKVSGRMRGCIIRVLLRVSEAKNREIRLQIACVFVTAKNAKRDLAPVMKHQHIHKRKFTLQKSEKRTSFIDFLKGK